MELTKVRQLISQDEEERGLELKPVVKCILSFLGSFLMMNPFVLMQMSPFSVSLIAALKGAYSLWASAGGIVGAFLFFSGTQTVKYIAVILLGIFLKGLSAKLLDIELRNFFSYIEAGCCLFVVGTAVMLATGFNAEEFIGTFYESVLAGAGAYIFEKSAEVVWSSREISRYSTSETACILIASGIMLMHFYRYKIVGFSPVIMIFVFCILVFARLKNGNGGTVCGLCLSFAAGLSGEIGFVCTGFALGGLIGGELVRKNRYLCVLGFFFPVCFCAIADGKIEAYMAVAETIVACAIFMAVPESIFRFLCGKINAPVPVYIKSDDGHVIARRLSEASGAINQISDCVSAVQHTLKPVPDSQLLSAVRSAWRKVCEECELNESCRNEVKNPSEEAIERLASALKNRAELDETRFPKGFYASCYSFTEMQSELKRRYLDFVANQGAQGQVMQMQGLMSDQFKSMADILHGIACDFDEEVNINSEAADSCADEAREFGLDVINVNSYLDKFGRISISLNISDSAESFDAGKFTDNLSDAIGTSLELTDIQEDEHNCTLKFSQKLSFDVSVGAKSCPVGNESVCGDYYRSMQDSNGRYIMVLSDGMGTGSRAAVDSAMASELFVKLIKSGLSFDCALPIANSALLVKSSDESLATLDVVCVDLYTGRTDFMKAGAAATFIRHRGQVAQLEQASLPMGILRDISFSKAAASLERGDIILMVSDGILGECNGWIQQELKLWQTENPAQRLAEYVVESACERKITKHRDDMTAIAIYIE